ncbi:MAG: LPS export ABC transporter periplasmic protein LptC [Bacteroidota bacterium]|nr:LPS export ABC transporter periplasmic protein LptC [Bacteroidota bacterium]
MIPRYLKNILPVICLVISVFLISGCSGKKEMIAPIKNARNIPSMSARNLEVIFSDSGKIQARLTGIVFNRFEGENPYIEFPQGFHIDIYDSAMKVETVISGNYGKRSENSRLIEAKGNVIVRNSLRNQQLNTESLFWDEFGRRIYTFSPVKITTSDKVLYGKGLEANESFTKYKITQVSGQMMVNKDSI